MYLITDAEQILNVVSDFVCDNVRLSKVAWRFETRTKFIVKGQIDIDLLIAWTVERPDSRVSKSTRRVRGLGKEYQLGPNILPAGLLELLFPYVFGVAEYK